MATVSGLNSNGLNFSGLATGIDSAKIIESLTAINQRRIDTFAARKADVQARQSAVFTLQARLVDLRLKSGALSRSAGGAFDGRKATVSDEKAIAVTAGTSAIPGQYAVTVNALARSHQVLSGGFADANAAIKTGTLTLRVGTGEAKTVTIDDRNATVQGLADAINAAGADVRATLIQDGTATPYRLLLTATKSGGANVISLTNDLTGGAGAAIDPAASTVQAATDASVTLGAGPGAVTVASASNTLSNLIPGVSLNLLKADVGSPVTITVSNDTEAATRAVQEFVDAYNVVRDYVSSQTEFDADTQSGGVLLGNRDVAGLTNDLADALTTTIPGLGPAANRLSSAGLAFADSGRLTFDAAKFNQAVSGQTGASIADLKKLFAVSGTSDNPGLAFSIASSKTRPTEGAPYQAVVTAPATRAAVTAGTPLAPSVVIDGTNNGLTLSVNGTSSGAITLDAGTYTPAALAAHVQNKINASAALSGNTVLVDVDGTGALRIASQQYGSSSAVALGGGTALAPGGPLGYAGAETASGTNVAGHFLVNGQIEAATGTGQFLLGKAGNAHTDGLQVRATLTAPGTANVTVSQGLAGRLGRVLDTYTNSDTGRLVTAQDAFKTSVKDFDASIAKQNTLMEEAKNRLILQFASMESAVNRLKGLQSQLSSLVSTSR